MSGERWRVRLGWRLLPMHPPRSLTAAGKARARSWWYLRARLAARLLDWDA